MVVIEEVEEHIPEQEESLNQSISCNPDHCTKATEDGGVLLEIIEEGEGEKPCLHAKCLVHYVGRLMQNGAVFLDTKEETEGDQPVILVAGRSSAPRDVGLCQAVSQMRSGGQARVYVLDPKYGYGEKGSFSFPSVPGNSSLVYDLHLLHWEPPSESEEDRGGLLYEERLERAERRRLAGNDLFREGKYKAAMGKYSMALSYLDDEFFYQLEGAYLTRAEQSKSSVHLNLAACQLKLRDWHTCVYNCTQALALGDPDKSPENRAFRAKALFRRGTARNQLLQGEDSLADLEEALKLEPRNANIQEELRIVRTRLRDEREASAALFKGKLPKTQASAASASASTSASAVDDDASKGADGASKSGAAKPGSSEKKAGLKGSMADLKAAASAMKFAVEAEAKMKSGIAPRRRSLTAIVAVVVAYVTWILRALFSRKPVLKEKAT